MYCLIQRVLKSEDARCGPLRRCYIAKPCNSESDCSPNYECLSPSQIRAKKLRELRMNQIFKRQRNRLARRQRSRNLRQNGGKAARFGGMQTGIKYSIDIQLVFFLYERYDQNENVPFVLPYYFFKSRC